MALAASCATPVFFVPARGKKCSLSSEEAVRRDIDLWAELESDPARGWERFAREYSGLVMQAIARLVDDQEERMDAYLFVMSKLSERDARRIRRFRSDSGEAGGSCSFGGWLRVVTRNLTIDWIRSREGRRFMPRAIASLPPLTRAVFRAVYWEGRTHAEAVEILRARDGADFSLGDLRLHLEEIETRLTRTYRANAARRLARRSSLPLSLDDESCADSLEWEVASHSESKSPERWVELGEIREAYRKALAGLDPEDRAIARLRFEEDRTAKEIAAEIGIADYTLLYPRIVRIAAKLRASMRHVRRGR
jgi:RNA polymerase sigma factor (sigma-70 family)